MPELPDLQVFSHNLDKQLAGKKVKKVTVVNDSKIKEPVAKFKNLEGATLTKVYREGKELRFEFSNGNVLGLHLMLHGKLHLFENKNEQKKPSLNCCLPTKQDWPSPITRALLPLP